ncbi:hypothetical protein QBC38DRAFT_503954 [Podospora fimiseda]|uniref:Uncharacterized protein n=1 Tax=Podospora fimiseda TaxID=252190 RepID=A0AAN6YNI0_9PEZI|nr:hypothetical protein QBC38DRAFT_503954 [Podospora fimiseda]
MASPTTRTPLLPPPSRGTISSSSSHPNSPQHSNNSNRLPQSLARQVHSEARHLRTITILTFLPAFPLLIAHGVLSQSLVPAIGLAPLFISAVVGLFLISKYRSKDRASSSHSHQHPHLQYVTDDVGAPDESEGWDDDSDSQEESVFTHRILVFFTDAGLTVGLAFVLIYTWVKNTQMSGDAILAMLAAYGTIPILINFLIHLYLTIREFIAGLALHGLIQYAAWHVLPPDCPDCGSRLRPEAHPPIPWYESVSRPNLNMTLTAPSLPALPKGPSFSSISVPAWLKRKSAAADPEGADARLFVDDDQIQRDRYRDEIEEASSTASNNGIVTGAIGSGSVVEEVVIVGKKDKKKRSISGSAPMYGEDDSSWA